MKLTPEQYNELLALQTQAQTAQANVQKFMRLLGLELDKAYTVSISVDDLIPIQETQPEEADKV